VGGLHLPHALCGHWRAGDVLPGLEASRHVLAVRSGWEAVTPGAAVRCDGAIGGEKALCMAWGLESPHTPLALAGGLVGILSAIVEIAVLPMRDVGQDFPLGHPLAGQFVGDDHPGHVGEPLEAFPQELLRSRLIPPALYEDVEHMAIWVDRPPQIMALTPNGEKDLIEMPLVAWSRTTAPEVIRIPLPELPAPVAHRFVRQGDAAGGHALCDIARAETEADIQPDAVADDLRREPMAFIQTGGGWWVHAASMACKVGAEQGGRLI
jgi:hypothetical protein